VEILAGFLLLVVLFETHLKNLYSKCLKKIENTKWNISKEAGPENL
jgi:hypothetical protein